MSDFPAKLLFKYTIVRWASVLAYTALVYYLCLLPGSRIPTNDFLDRIYFDKWVHIMMYFGMWSLIVWLMKGPGQLIENRKRNFLIAAILCLLMGASIELLQEQIGRGKDWTDELANLGGVMLGWYCWIKNEHRWGVYSW
jgi:VanZ family protein